MPARGRLLVAFTLKQLLPTFHLRVVPVFDLEPRRLQGLRDVRSVAMLRNDAFQVHFADLLKQRLPVLLDVFHVLHSGFRHLQQQTAEFVFAVCQSFRVQILAISHQQVECEKARLTAMKQQVTELRPPALIQTIDLPVEAIRQLSPQGPRTRKVSLLW